MSDKQVVIIGSGLGGLACGVILSKEGFKVTVLEKNKVIGGCLQSFKRKGRILDTGMHYVGSLADGEVLNQCFKYFEIMPELRIKRLDDESFDVVHIRGKDYPHAAGYAHFIETLARFFPGERENLSTYCDKVSAIGSQISVENMRKGLLTKSPMIDYGVPASRFIDSTIGNPVLKDVLAGNLMLYGGIKGVTTLYHHAMITHSNLQGAYRFIDGSQQVADLMAGIIKQNGGEVLTGQEVTAIETAGTGSVKRVITNRENSYEPDVCISAIHPLVSFRLLDKTPLIRKAFLSRLTSLSNSYGVFTVYMLMKPLSMPYFNKNYYLHSGGNVWESGEKNFRGDNMLIYTYPCSVNPDYAQVVALMKPMYFDEVAHWQSSGPPDKRCAAYYDFKEKEAEKMIDTARNYMPQLKGNIEYVFTTTPLSFQDYTGTPEGSAYGIIKDASSPLQTFIPSRTKLDNFLLTGQNLNVHGALGVIMTAAATCAELLGTEYLMKKIGNA